MNRLQDATSPYLLQHAGNPVHWWPWCPEALDTARRHDRPVLLSIGYSACHWCHVMAHESFDDPDLAEKMNRGFVNIKVDREQRPDLDRIYQLAHQVLTDRAGGWPLTVFLDPHSRLPFFAGTYFPPDGRPGLPGFGELLDRISDYWENRRDEIQTNTDNLHDYLEGIGSTQCSDDALTGEPGLQALTVLERQYDDVHGGFGAAPKFPATGSLRFLMEWSGFNTAQREHADEMIQHSLAKMAAGGLYDQLEGGFFRYSVDPQWAIPHFEKMTSDNALLLWLYARAARHWQRDDFAATARELAQWVMQNLQDPAGAYHSSWDADSDGQEGLWYLWTRDQFDAALSQDEAMLAGRYWGLDRPPNYDGQAWHLVQASSIDEVARGAGVGRSLARDCIHNARKKLARARHQRPPPGRDDKVLSGWNGLMIGAMATAARLLGAADMLRSAHRALADVQARLWVDGRLLACARGEQSEFPAYLDDYAYLLDGTLELLTTAWRPADLQFARRLADALLVHFEDPEQGGFYFTSHDHETLPQRAKPMADEATPSGNAVAARSLLRLGRLIAEPRLESAAERVLRNAWSDLQRAPQVCGAMLGALDEWLNPPRQIVLRGERSELREVWQSLADRLPVRDQVYALDPGSLLERFPRAGGFSAYLCQGHQCSAPVTSPAELLAMLEERAD